MPRLIFPATLRNEEHALEKAGAVFLVQEAEGFARDHAQRIVIVGYFTGNIDAGERTAGNKIEIDHEFFARLSLGPVAMKALNVHDFELDGLLADLPDGEILGLGDTVG